uniref:LIM zinc-binding domain-containing protein n=1 Tax=Timema tahoe TaxID=61484 RepID=A0A7R9IJC1_9NEOP|nr:unnamed protein product [Timema tahoe]
MNNEANNFVSKETYCGEMSKLSTYGTTCELEAPVHLYPWRFEVYQNGQLLVGFVEPGEGLIFVKEYTMAEEHAFHVKHFCCFECDVPLGGKKYVVKHDQPVCLSCYAKKYGKKCYTCEKLIAAEDQRVSFNDFHWHVTDSCFCCHQCSKPLAGRKFVVKKEQPLCSSECVMEFLRFNN